MKIIYKTIFVGLVSILQSYAQEQIVSIKSNIDEEISKTYYFKDIDGDLNKFLGTWIYTDTNKELIVTFHLKLHEIDGLGDSHDEIYAKFKYTENGTVIYDILNESGLSSELKITGSTFLDKTVGNFTVVDVNKMDMFYNEPTNIPYTRSPYQSLNIEYLPCTEIGCSHQLKWDIIWTRQKATDVWPFRLPNHIILTKL